MTIVAIAACLILLSAGIVTAGLGLLNPETREQQEARRAQWITQIRQAGERERQTILDHVEQARITLAQVKAEHDAQIARMQTENEAMTIMRRGMVEALRRPPGLAPQPPAEAQTGAYAPRSFSLPKIITTTCQEMTDRPNPPDLPRGMALIETAAGRWFPACAPLEDPPWLVQIVRGSTDIPPALEPHHDPEQGYPTRSLAIGACLAWQEAAVLPVHWDKLAAHTELYPERNAWYLDEIAHLTGDDTPFLSCGTNVYAVVMADQDDLDGTILAEGDSIDEAIEALYQRVSAWYDHKHTIQKRAS